MKAPLPSNELLRLEALHRYRILDTSPEVAYDRVTRLASRLFGADIALVSFVDEKRQWFKSACGLHVSQTERDLAFCGYTILSDSVMCVPDALRDSRFCRNGLVLGAPHIRFYAGAPLKAGDGLNLGTLCVIDTKPRPALSDEENATLEDLAAIVVSELNLRLTARILADANEQLGTLAHTDPLTSLPNRMAFEDQLRLALEQCHRSPAALFYMDLDGFKAVNDGPGGHSAGDQVLRAVAQRLQSELPRDARLARVGGDEFVALVNGLDREGAARLAAHLCRAFAVPVETAERSFAVGLSIGIALAPDDGVNGAELMGNADRAMYETKHHGGAHFRMAAGIAA